MPNPVLLVHSPVVGPSIWAPFAALIAERGVEVRVPDLTYVTESDQPWFEVFVDTAVAAIADLEDSITVVGHSGAGVFLPKIGSRLGDRLESLVFVDAVIPPESGSHESSAAMEALLDTVSIDGLLRPWLEWWPAEVVASLLPDADQRADLLADMPRLPRSFYDEKAPVPAEWSEFPCVFIELSSAYEAEFEMAGSRGWPRLKLDGTHLSVFTQPANVLDALDVVTAEISDGPLL